MVKLSHSNAKMKIGETFLTCAWINCACGDISVCVFWVRFRFDTFYCTHRTDKCHSVWPCARWECPCWRTQCCRLDRCWRPSATARVGSRRIGDCKTFCTRRKQNARRSRLFDPTISFSWESKQRPLWRIDRLQITSSGVLISWKLEQFFDTMLILESGVKGSQKYCSI